MRCVIFALAFLITEGGSRRRHWGQSADDKIVGGSEVPDIREAPYAIAISLVHKDCAKDVGLTDCTDPKRWYYTCAGSLLSPLYVVTACHCVADFKDSTAQRLPAVEMSNKKEAWRFVAGSRSINPLERTAQVRIPSALHHHPNCAKEEILAISDIGVAKMRNPFTVNDYVRPVKLFSTQRRKFQAAFNSMLLKTPNCRVSGWGSTGKESIASETNEPVSSGNGSDVSVILKTAKMEVLEQGTCLKTFKSWANHELDNATMNFSELDQICIVSRKGSEGFCSGDSGGPFVCDGYLVALVSNSMECGTPLPQICQTVQVLFDWARKDLCRKSDCTDVYYYLKEAPEIVNGGRNAPSVEQKGTEIPATSIKKKRRSSSSTGVFFVGITFLIITLMSIPLLIN